MLHIVMEPPAATATGGESRAALGSPLWVQDLSGVYLEFCSVGEFYRT